MSTAKTAKFCAAYGMGLSKLEEALSRDPLRERISTIKTVQRCTTCNVWVHENDLVPLSLDGYYGHNSRYLGTNNDELVELCVPVEPVGIRLVTNHGRVLSPEQVKEYRIV